MFSAFTGRKRQLSDDKFRWSPLDLNLTRCYNILLEGIRQHVLRACSSGIQSGLLIRGPQVRFCQARHLPALMMIDAGECFPFGHEMVTNVANSPSSLGLLLIRKQLLIRRFATSSCMVGVTWEYVSIVSFVEL